METPENSAKVRPDVKISPIPETLNISGRDTTVLAVETPVKDDKETVAFPSTVEKKIVIPDSEGLHFSKASEEQDENGMDGKMNDRIMGKVSTSTKKLDSVPDSMEVDSSPEASRKGFDSTRCSQDEEEESKWRPTKRTRVLDSTDETETEKDVIPTKRARNEAIFELPEQAPSTEGCDNKEEYFEEDDDGMVEQMLGKMVEFEENVAQLDLSPVQPEDRVDGFLSKKIIGKVRVFHK